MTDGQGSPVLFIHVMKAGGTTVMRHLRETFELDEIYPYRPLDVRFDEGGVAFDQHLSVGYVASLSAERRRRIRAYTGHFPYVLREFMGGDLLTATVLRDPVERTISLLRQFRRKQPWDDPDERRPLAELSLEDVYETPIVFGPLVHNHQTKIFSMTREDDPQTYMDDIEIDRQRLGRAKANLAEVDVVGLTERFDDFLDEAEQRFGWQIVRGARKNATPPTDDRQVDSALRRRIAADNAIDLEFYEYAKELVASRRGRRVVGA